MCDAHAQPTSTEETAAVTSIRVGWLRRLGLLIAIALIVGAVIAVARQRHFIVEAWSAIQDHSPARLAGLLIFIAATIVANIVLTGVVFHLLTSRYGKVGVLEMQALIATATLMNFVPMRPGLFGRLAYHKAYNGIAIRDSAKVVVQALALSIGIVGYLATCAWMKSGWSIDLRITIFAALAALIAAAFMARGAHRLWLLAGAVRLCETVVIAARYFAAFLLIGSPIQFSAALAFACLGVIATMVPFLSNGLGLREWAVGLVAPMITAYQMELGMTADLIIRAAELVVVAAVGTASFAWLVRHQRHVLRSSQSS